MSSPWEDIEKIFVRKYSPLGEYGGWGIRFSLSGKGRALNISGNNGIQLVFSNNAKLLGINKFREEIESLFEIFGLIEDEGFVPFEPGKNYKAFVVKRKPSTFT